MVLRKPYAFLIKNFRRINFVLLLLVLFSLWRDLSLYDFVKTYASTGIYNVRLDSISNYINILSVGALLLSVVISATLTYLLKYKEKPYISYLIMTMVGILNIALFIYINYYFTVTVMNASDLSQSLVVRDLSFIMTLPYYASILLLIIRSLGIDLKNFGFGEDKDFINADELDREEVEVEVSFDKDKYIREIRKNIRYFKYFFLENKLIISSIFAVVLVLVAYNIYHYNFVTNKVYHPGDTLNVKNLSITTKNAYLTNRDYTGNIIKDESYFLIVDMSIVNHYRKTVNVDSSYFFLYIGNKYYIPTTRFNKSFTDMGRLFESDQKFEPNVSESTLLIFEIDKPDRDSNILLTYQPSNASENPKRIKLQIRDISEFVEKGKNKTPYFLSFPINNEEKWNVSFTNIQINDTFTYRYRQCNSNTCPVYERNVVKKNGKTILYTRVQFEGDYQSKDSFQEILKKYGKIRYTINGQVKEEKVSLAVDKCQGNHLYFSVSDEIKNAETIEIIFTVRSYQYIYRLKGE